MIFSVGDTFEVPFIVTVDTYESFIQLSNDKNPLHTDEQFAISKGFKGRVMHGNILNGFLSYFIGECLPVKNIIIHSQNIQFNNAVYLGDKLHLKAYVYGIFESVNAVEFKYEFRNSAAKLVAKGIFQIGILK